jgi:hypothetical protein
VRELISKFRVFRTLAARRTLETAEKRARELISKFRVFRTLAAGRLQISGIAKKHVRELIERWLCMPCGIAVRCQELP